MAKKRKPDERERLIEAALKRLPDFYDKAKMRELLTKTPVESWPDSLRPGVLKLNNQQKGGG